MPIAKDEFSSLGNDRMSFVSRVRFVMIVPVWCPLKPTSQSSMNGVVLPTISLWGHSCILAPLFNPTSHIVSVITISTYIFLRWLPNCAYGTVSPREMTKIESSLKDNLMNAPSRLTILNYSVLTTAFLINRTLSKTLNFLSPYEKLYNTKSDITYVNHKVTQFVSNSHEIHLHAAY